MSELRNTAPCGLRIGDGLINNNGVLDVKPTGGGGNRQA